MKFLTMIASLGLAVSLSANAAVMGIGDYTDNLDGSYELTNGLGSVSDSDLESFLGLSAGTLDTASTGDATEGSALKDSVEVKAGETFSFEWQWSSKDGGAYNDFAFVHLDLDGISVLADTTTVDRTTDTFSWVATSTGWLSYGIGISDVKDTIFESYLTVSNIKVSPVPEPGTIALLGMGLIGLAVVRKRQSA